MQQVPRQELYIYREFVFKRSLQIQFQLLSLNTKKTGTKLENTEAVRAEIRDSWEKKTTFKLCMKIILLQISVI